MNAAASAPAAAGGAMGAGLWSSLLVTVLALAFVLALAWLFLRLLKRATTLRSADGRAPPQVVQAVPLGGRERLVVVRDGGHEYVLGVTAASVSLIDKRLAAQAAQPDDAPTG
ncbi:flagellar biosynthetic protein FliO [Ottowia testudinis]|uniref:Flagellar biosynthetic protein FliO n=1 Tax=Ottowia testudinis TaxID=2816950 RepID=A0A975CJT9_9BURK|nr:flagellar biosynthetic protein FliO [Ottowia testudinis]QTD45494.1 flagellar biosynthetic protein FliO [Ottowia testudinis]